MASGAAAASSSSAAAAPAAPSSSRLRALGARLRRLTTSGRGVTSPTSPDAAATPPGSSPASPSGVRSALRVLQKCNRAMSRYEARLVLNSRRLRTSAAVAVDFRRARQDFLTALEQVFRDVDAAVVPVHPKAYRQQYAADTQRELEGYLESVLYGAERLSTLGVASGELPETFISLRGEARRLNDAFAVLRVVAGDFPTSSRARRETTGPAMQSHTAALYEAMRDFDAAWAAFEEPFVAALIGGGGGGGGSGGGSGGKRRSILASTELIEHFVNTLRAAQASPLACSPSAAAAVAAGDRPFAEPASKMLSVPSAGPSSASASSSSSASSSASASPSASPSATPMSPTVITDAMLADLDPDLYLQIPRLAVLYGLDTNTLPVDAPFFEDAAEQLEELSALLGSFSPTMMSCTESLLVGEGDDDVLHGLLGDDAQRIADVREAFRRVCAITDPLQSGRHVRDLTVVLQACIDEVLEAPRTPVASERRPTWHAPDAAWRPVKLG